MTRKPVYHDDDPAYRVCFRQPNLWVAQRRSEAKATREYDPWEDLHPPRAEQADAIMVMYSRRPKA